MRNYLLQYMEAESAERLKKAEAALAGAAEEDLLAVRASAARDLANLQMQMEMLVYSTMDVFNEKANIIPDRVKATQDKRDKEQGRTELLSK